MKISPRTLLAAALLTALPMGSALACTITNWNGTGTATLANVGTAVGDGIPRYSGACGLSVNAGQFVMDNTPSAESTYRVRFYVRPTGAGSANTVIFRATADNNGNGNEVLRVGYNGGAFTFFQNSNSAGSVTGILPNRWYSIEMFYNAGGQFTANVAGAVNGTTVFTGAITPVATSGAGTVGSAMLGLAAGSTGTGFAFDAFVSTKAAAPVGRLCRGDADGDSQISAGDRSGITAEIRGTYTGGPNGVPDCDEDGDISAGDRACITALIRQDATCS